MRKIMIILVSLVSVFSLIGCSNQSRSEVSKTQQKVDKGDIKNFRKALIQWCKNNYSYDENWIKSNAKKNGNKDDKTLKESYEYDAYLTEKSGFSLHSSESSKGVQVKKVLATTVVCKNDINTDKSSILYFEDAFVFKATTDDEKERIKADFSSYGYFDGEYYYSVGKNNIYIDFTDFLKEYSK